MKTLSFGLHGLIVSLNLYFISSLDVEQFGITAPAGVFLLVVADDVDQPEVVPGEQQPVEVLPVDGLTAPPALHGLHNNPVSPQYSTVQYSTVSTLQYSTVQYSTVQSVQQCESSP